MNNQRIGLRVAALIFAVVSLAHLVRWIARLEIVVAGTAVPLWVSIPGFAAAGLLALWLWRLARPELKR